MVVATRAIRAGELLTFDYTGGAACETQGLAERRAIDAAFAQTAAKLHAVRPSETAGLEALGKGGGYLARQV